MPRQPAIRRTICFTTTGSPGLDRHADHQRAARRQQTPERVEQRCRIDDVLEDLHAVDRVVGALMRRPIEILDEHEVEALLLT